MGEKRQDVSMLRAWLAGWRAMEEEWSVRQDSEQLVSLIARVFALTF